MKVIPLRPLSSGVSKLLDLTRADGAYYERLECDAEVKVNLFEVTAHTLDNGTDLARPYVHLECEVVNLTVAPGYLPYNIGQLQPGSDSRPLLHIDYELADDQLKAMIDKGYFHPGSIEPPKALEHETIIIHLPQHLDLMILTDAQAESEQSIVGFYKLAVSEADGSNLAADRESIGYDLVDFMEVNPAFEAQLDGEQLMGAVEFAPAVDREFDDVEDEVTTSDLAREHEVDPDGNYTQPEAEGVGPEAEPVEPIQPTQRDEDGNPIEADEAERDVFNIGFARIDNYARLGTDTYQQAASEAVTKLPELSQPESTLGAPQVGEPTLPEDSAAAVHSTSETTETVETADVDSVDEVEDTQDEPGI